MREKEEEPSLRAEPNGARSGKLVDVGLPVIVFALFLLLWETIVEIARIPPYILPAPSVILATLIKDWPLLSASLMVSAPEAVQRERVLARPGMTVEKFEAIKARQTPDHEKRARADFIVDTSKGFADARDQVKRIIDVLRPAANDGMN